MKMTAIIVAIFLLIYPLIERSYASRAPVQYPFYRVKENYLYNIVSANCRREIFGDGTKYETKDVTATMTEADIIAQTVACGQFYFNKVSNESNNFMRVGSTPKQIKPPNP